MFKKHKYNTYIWDFSTRQKLAMFFVFLCLFYFKESDAVL